MPRQVDLQLLAVAAAAGVLVCYVVGRWSSGRRVGVMAICGGLGLAAAGDRWLVDAVPRDVVRGVVPWLFALAVGVAVAWGADRLPVTPTVGMPPVLPLALAALVGVWAGVPETSAAILAVGVLLGLALALLAGRLFVTRSAAVAIAVAPVGAACIGAVGEVHSLVGGFLCAAPVVAVGLGPVVRAVSGTALVQGTLLHLVVATVAARHLGVSRDWDAAFVVIPVILVLSVAIAAVLRQGQRATEL